MKNLQIVIAALIAAGLFAGVVILMQPSKQDKRIDAMMKLVKAPDSDNVRAAKFLIGTAIVQNAQSPELCAVAFQLNVPEDSLRKNCK